MRILSTFCVLAVASLWSDSAYAECRVPDTDCTEQLASRGNQKRHRFCRDALDLYEQCLERERWPYPVEEFEFDGFFTSDDPPRAGQFIRRDPVTGEYELQSPCSFSDALSPVTVEGNAIHANWDADLRAAAQRSLFGATDVEPSNDWNDIRWERMGLFTRSIAVTGGAQIGAVSASVDISTGNVSFQAWRETGGHSEIPNGFRRAARNCCAATECGDYLITEWTEMQRLEATLTEVDFDANARTIVWRADAATHVANANTQQSIYYVLQVERVTISPETEVEELCTFPPLWTVEAEESSGFTAQCLVDGIIFGVQGFDNLDSQPTAAEVQSGYRYNLTLTTSRDEGDLLRVTMSLGERTAESVAVVIDPDDDELPRVGFERNESGEWWEVVISGGQLNEPLRIPVPATLYNTSGGDEAPPEEDPILIPGSIEP